MTHPNPNELHDKIDGLASISPKPRGRSIATLDVETDYPAQLNVGDTIHSASGFLIGTIVDVVS